MADTSDGAVPQALERIELTDEDRAVLKECTRNSVFFRGIPAGIISVALLSQAVKIGYFPQVKRYTGIAYTALFGFAFYTGVRSYSRTCIAKIMNLENSNLKERMIKNMQQRSGKEGSGQIISEQKDLSLPGDIRFGTPEESPHTYDPSPLSSSIPASAAEGRSSEVARAPPSLYFDVEEAKEKNYTSYEELRKKHRERWTPPNMSSPGSSRMEQPRYRRDSEQDSRTGSSDTSPSWFDQDNSSDDHGDRHDTGQRSNSQRERPLYRQGPPPKKNKYGDVME